jgi:hypothetical protein
MQIELLLSGSSSELNYTKELNVFTVEVMNVQGGDEV